MIDYYIQTKYDGLWVTTAKWETNYSRCPSQRVLTGYLKQSLKDMHEDEGVWRLLAFDSDTGTMISQSVMVSFT